MKRPPRTLGISLAILAAASLFSCLPLLQVFMLTLLRSRLTTQFADNGSLDTGAWAASGGEVFGVSQDQLLIQAVLALAFLIIAILAWRGRPPAIRWVFVAGVLMLSAGNIGLLINSVIAPQSIETGFDSGGDFMRSLAVTQLCITVAIPLYVVWYMNRAPARAFYRGRYMEPNSEANQAQNE